MALAKGHKPSGGELRGVKESTSMAHRDDRVDLPMQDPYISLLSLTNMLYTRFPYGRACSRKRQESSSETSQLVLVGHEVNEALIHIFHVQFLNKSRRSQGLSRSNHL